MNTAEDFRYMTDSFRATGAPLYARICEAAASDDAIIEIAARVPAGQPPAILFLAAAHFVLSHAADEPLAAFYPSLTPTPRTGPELYPIFREFCLRHRQQIEQLVASRTVQLTSADRATYILFALSHVAGEANAPLHVIEVGASAGLCLMFDQFRHDLGGSHFLGPEDSPVRVQHHFRGAPPPLPRTLPPIASRTGIDLMPLDAGRQEQADWVLTSMYPDWRDESCRLRAALAMRREYPLHMIAGDAMAVLPTLVRSTPDPICVLHSACLYQWPAEARARFGKLLRELSTGRTLYRVGIEPESIGREERRRMYRAGQEPHVDMELTIYRSGTHESRQLARCEGFGRWIEWLA
ncbi:MAG: DUF2332 domain-containing protein [Steroidobacteraceae bacterium]